jgi:hypothetical protein
LLLVDASTTNQQSTANSKAQPVGCLCIATLQKQLLKKNIHAT